MHLPWRCVLFGVILVGHPWPARAQPWLEAAPPLVQPFSTLQPGAPLPAAWEPVRITEGKRPTHYRLVADQGVVVLHARAVSAASALGHATDVDIRAAPNIEWRWKINRLMEAADNAQASREDAVARIVLEFDGNKARLPLRDRAFFLLANRLSGRDVPYATLMYIRATRGNVGDIIANPRTSRIQMVVAGAGPQGVGDWEVLRRDVRADFVRAFGEEPGHLIAVGVLTDSDNTGDTAEAWYGDIRFLP